MSHSDDDLAWLPAHGVVLTHNDLVEIMHALHLIRWATDDVEPARLHMLSIVATIHRAIERQGGL